MTPNDDRYDVLAFGAHPDDLEMGMGGTIALLAGAGRRVLMVSLTQSQMSTHGDPQTRRAEFERAAGILGCDPLLLDFPDTRVENDQAGRERLAVLVRRHRPRIVFAPFHTNEGGHHDGAANRDHMEAGHLVRDALKLARFPKVVPQHPPHDVHRLYYYMVPEDRKPSIIIDVTPVEETLRAAIRAYASQMPISRAGSAIEDLLFVIRRRAGLSIGVPLGESFITDQIPDVRVEELFRED